MTRADAASASFLIPGSLLTGENRMSQKYTEEPARTSFMATMGAVAWSFVGLRRSKDFDKDVTGLNPVYVIIAALIGVAIFIAVILTIVRIVVA
jgi:Protein of unknown function (DUF2970)